MDVFGTKGCDGWVLLMSYGFTVHDAICVRYEPVLHTAYCVGGRANICTSSVKCSVEGDYMQLVRIICSISSGQLQVQMHLCDLANCQMWTRESALHLLWRTGAATRRASPASQDFNPPSNRRHP